MRIGAALLLGLFSGSLVLEGLVLVPFWRTLPAGEFFTLHQSFGPRLFRYFAPITTAAVVFSLGAAIADRQHNAFRASAGAALCAVITLSAFPLFFAKANRAFEHRSLTDDDLPHALRQWATVHAARTVMSVLAFAFSLLALA